MLCSLLLLVGFGVVGCTRPGPVREAAPAIGDRLERRGEEIVVCGELFHVGAPVVLWMDPGGYDAYRTEKRFGPYGQSAWNPERGPESPNRFSLRRPGRVPPLVDQVRGGGWELEQLRDVVDQFVLHYDACGTSELCFKVLHDERGLSVHFLLDVDGTIYQTLDLKERAWHATIANDRCIGVEIANIGAYPLDRAERLEQWYERSSGGDTVMTIPPGLRDGVRTPGFVGRPARDEAIVGDIQGETLVQYDFTPEQYESLIKLTTALCEIFPKIRCEAPRDNEGVVLDRALSAGDFAAFQGVLGHYHIQTNKVDPGPAFQWEYVLDEAREMMESSSE
jgi:hypothetical protein